MDIERLKELADCDVFIGGNPIVVDRAQETLRKLIDEAIEDEYLRVIQAYDTPYNYCPNCGRKIKED